MTNLKSSAGILIFLHCSYKIKKDIVFLDVLIDFNKFRRNICSRFYFIRFERFASSNYNL